MLDGCIKESTMMFLIWQDKVERRRSLDCKLLYHVAWAIRLRGGKMPNNSLDLSPSLLLAWEALGGGVRSELVVFVEEFVKAKRCLKGGLQD